jgi:hypothetical protein
VDEVQEAYRRPPKITDEKKGKKNAPPAATRFVVDPSGSYTKS